MMNADLVLHEIIQQTRIMIKRKTIPKKKNEKRSKTQGRTQTGAS